MELKFTHKKRYLSAKTCPCGRSNRDGKFNPYEGHQDKGYCHSCGETFSPDGDEKTRYKPAEPIRQKFISLDILKRTIGGYDKNNLYLWIKNIVGDAGANSIVSRFFVGTSKESATVFWTIDNNLKICQPKVVYYNVNGHRDKSKFISTPKGYTRDSGYRPCLFGLHQLNSKYGPAKPVVLVESEKTACLGYYTFPQFTWLACGGASGLSEAKTKALRGHNVIIIPDADEAGRKGADKTHLRLSQMGIVNTVVDLWPERIDGYDLADYIADVHQAVIRSRELIPDKLVKLIKKNPALDLLIDKLDCKVISCN